MSENKENKYMGDEKTINRNEEAESEINEGAEINTSDTEKPVRDDMNFIDEDIEEKEADNTESKTKKKFRLNIHAVLIGAIFIFLAASVIKLVTWNKGITLNFDKNEDTSEFDVEILDEILPLASDGASGHTYDDETTILLLGNGTLAFTRFDENGFAQRIANAVGATVYNGAFPYVTLATQNLAMIEQNYPGDIYSLSYLADAACTGDFSELDRITEIYYQDGNFTQDALRVLKSVDYDNLDVIIIMYDAQDYFKERAIENPKDSEERSTYMGSLRYAVNRFKEAFPYTRIIVSSMYYTTGTGSEGETYDPDLVDKGHGTISNYIYTQLQTCADLSVTFLDNFYGTINQNNHAEYIDYEAGADYIKLNDAGMQALADRIAYAVSKFPNDK